MKSFRRQAKCPVPIALTWSHSGVLCRVTAWPEVQFERLYGNDWTPMHPSEDALACAAQALGPLDWRPYLEFVPREVREFITAVPLTRMEALQVAARCPALLPALAETPALTAFVSSHVALRGTPAPCWEEISAVHERTGVYGVMEWLGLPASRQTLGILHKVAAPGLPKRCLELLRTLLWEPQAIFVLQRMPVITDRHLARHSHALAA